MSTASAPLADDGTAGERLENRGDNPNQNQLRGSIPADKSTVNRRSQLIKNPKKIFVGGLPSAGVSRDELKDHFGKFGVVEDVRLIHEFQTGKPRGFAFVTFEEEEGASKALEVRFQTLKSKVIEVKMALPWSDPQLQGKRKTSSSRSGSASCSSVRPAGMSMSIYNAPHFQGFYPRPQCPHFQCGFGYDIFTNYGYGYQPTTSPSCYQRKRQGPVLNANALPYYFTGSYVIPTEVVSQAAAVSGNSSEGRPGNGSG